jgi:dTDP-glucose pyrophosphorylase/CBS domain-containing protein
MGKSKKLPFISPESTLSQAMAVINDFNKGIALIIDQNLHLIGTITDGDIRRAILKNISLQENVTVVLKEKKDSPYSEPISASVDTPVSDLLIAMQKRMVRQLPILDHKHRVVDLITLDDLLPKAGLPLQAVIMAGGFGKRLRPLTDETPKPMLPVGDRPLMQLIIDQLRVAGVSNVFVTTHYQPEKIKRYFGSGKDFGVNIEYVSEDKPLGTAGALGLLKALFKPLLVINGDILTRMDIRGMLDYHNKQGADFTVAVYPYEQRIPFGVLDCDNGVVKAIREKPVLTMLVNAGVYLLAPSVHKFIPSNQRFDMTDLISRLLEDGRKVVSFPIVEYWLDIGHLDDYGQAQKDVLNGRVNP